MADCPNFHDHEKIEDAKPGRHHHKEIAGHQGLGVVGDEGHPARLGIRPASGAESVRQIVWFYDDQGAPPVQEPAQQSHQEPCRVGGAVRFDLAFLEPSQLFPQQQVLRRQRTLRSTQQRRQAGEVRKEVTDHKKLGEARDQMACKPHEDSGSYARGRLHTFEKTSVPIYCALQQFGLHRDSRGGLGGG